MRRTGTTLCWLRDDLRLRDNPALSAAAEQGGPIACVYVLDDGAAGARPLGGAARWWLAQSLRTLARALAERGSELLLFRGDPTTALNRVARALRPASLVFNRRYGAVRALDEALAAAFRASGIEVESFKANLLVEPDEVATREGKPITVFSPFWRAARALGEPQRPLSAPEALRGLPAAARKELDPVALDALGLEPKTPDWAGGLRETWMPGESGAAERLSAFLAEGLAGYARERDRPDRNSTSGLSPHLRFGEISPRQVWHAASAALHAGTTGASDQDVEKFLSELGWREFFWHLLHHWPDLASRNVQGRFDSLPWRESRADLHAWQRGRTGIPIVDAGMRQLWHTGWMHNRVRMVVASFFTKHLLLDWRQGEAWFWDTLVDADGASNPANWQWVAGSGADAAPYFRVFNPVLQGEKFDPEGEYVRRWVPELAGLRAPLIHRPWSAASLELSGAGVSLGDTYPEPIVDLDRGRTRALAAFETIKARQG